MKLHVITLRVAQKSEEILVYFKTIQFNKEVIHVIDKGSSDISLSCSASALLVWIDQSSFTSELYSFFKCKLGLATDRRVTRISTEAFCENQLAVWLEFMIKKIIYFVIVCKSFALYLLYQ